MSDVKCRAVVGMPVKKRLRFRDEDDIALLREVAGQNPFVNTDVWDIIKQHVLLLTGKDFTIKTLKDHLDLLIKLWLEKNKIMKVKSGTEEDYTEKEQLCQDIYDAMIQFRNKPKKKITKQKANQNAGKLSRDEWANHSLNSNIEIEVLASIGDNTNKENIVIEDITMESVNIPDHEYCNFIAREDTIDTGDFHNSTLIEEKEKVEAPQQAPEQPRVLRPTRARKRKISVQRQGLSYLEQYDNNQVELKKRDQILEEKRIAIEERKLNIEERKLELAEKKFELDEYEKKKTLQILEDRLASEIQQRKDLTKIIERQDKIFEMLLSQRQN